MKRDRLKTFVWLALFGCLGSALARAEAKTVTENTITYLGADWGPEGDTVYFLKQVMTKKRTTGGLSKLLGGVENLGSSVWFCKMKWDGSEKQEIAELWAGQGPYIDTQGGPLWLEVNAATSNAAFSVEFGRNTVGIWVIGLDGKNLHKLFELPWSDKNKIRGLHPSWSPDGTRLVYTERDVTTPTTMHWQLAIYDLAKKERKLLTEGPRDDHAVWSPKGDWIAYMHCVQCDENRADTRIWLTKPDGSEQRPVVNEKNVPIFGWWPSWNPDGTKIGIADVVLRMADLANVKASYIDPLPILGESLPYTFMGHHWGKRGWLLAGSGSLRLIDEQTRKGRWLAAGGIYDSTSKDLQWGLPPQDIPPHVQPEWKGRPLPPGVRPDLKGKPLL